MHLTQKLQSLKNQDLLLICGELTPQELRTAKALINWVTTQIQKEEKNPKTHIKNLKELENQLLQEITKKCPPESAPNSSAIPQLNQLERASHEICKAVEILKTQTEKLLPNPQHP